MKKIFTLLLLAFFATLSASNTRLNSAKIIACPTATISYVGSPYCTTISSGTVTLTGTDAFTGGAFSSTAGLFINADTGTISPNTSTPGTYIVTYTIAPGGGCPGFSTTTTVTITAAPTATIFYNSPFCPTAPTQSVTMTGTGSYEGGTFIATSGLNLNAATGAITPSLSTPGIYTVTYTTPASGGCSSLPITTTVTIAPAPTATIGFNQTICFGNSTFINFTGTPNATISYNINGGANQVITLNSSGSAALSTSILTSTTVYNLVSVSSVSGCSSAVSGSATMTVIPTPTIAGTFSACAGSMRQLTGSGIPAASNPWMSSNTAVATVSSFGLVTAMSPGITTITYTSNNGCSTSQTIIIHGSPTITGTLSACPGSTTQLMGSGVPAASNSWLSSNPAVATVSPTGLVTIVSAGTSSITYTDSNGCSTSSTVTGLPAGGPLNLFCDGSTPTSVSFDWNNIVGITIYDYSYSINGGPIISGSQVAPTNIAIPTATCSSVTFTLQPRGSVCVPPQTITCSCVLSTTENSLTKLVYSPNPVTDFLTIKNDLPITEINVINQLGQTVLQKSYNNTDLQVDLSGLGAGMYFVTVASDTKQSTFKAIKR